MIRQRIQKLTALVVLLCAALLPSAAIAQGAAPDGETLERIEDYVAEQFRSNGIIGGSYAIVRDGEVVAAAGLGVADLETEEPVTPETVYATASVTKVFTAAAILKLAEEGTIDLDAPVRTYIPWFTYKDRERSENVTIRHLLLHAAGVSRFEADGSIFREEKNNRDSLENAVRALGTVSMTDDPGERGAYCNSCYNVLGLVIEHATGADYEQYMKDIWFIPLGMEATSFDSAHAAHTASEYHWMFGMKRKSAPNHVVFGASQNPEGGIYSNVLDLSRFLAAMMGDGERPMLSAETLSRSQQGEIDAGDDAEYTLSGFEEKRIRGTRVLYKAGDGIGSTAYALMIPELRIGISILVGDSVPEFAAPLAEGMAAILLGETPDDVRVGVTFWRLLGFVSLGLVIIGLVLLLLLAASIVKRLRSPKPLKRKWRVIVRTALSAAFALPVAWLLIAVHPTQIGFYGYPHDFAIGLLSVLTACGLWTVFGLAQLAAGKGAR